MLRGEQYVLKFQYLYLNDIHLDDTHPEVIKIQKNCGDLCKVKLKEGAIEEFFDLGFHHYFKNLHVGFALPRYILL